MLSYLLKEYREKYDITQEQLAGDLHVDVRTIRRWETQETNLKDTEELRRIASTLGIAPERVGVVNESITKEQADETIEHIWHLVNTGRAYEARSIAERLSSDLQSKAKVTGTQQDIAQLTNAHHAAAYSRSMNTRISEIRFPLSSYHNMEETARIINDPLPLSIALTYRGDMYNRTGATEKGIPYLQEAIALAPDAASKGNALQLLARAYFKEENLAGFDRVMKEAENLAASLDGTEITRGQYGLISVYEEYGKSYALLGETQKSLDYLEKAYALGTPDIHWKMVLKTAKVVTLIRGGEIEAGTDLALEAIEECRRYGTIRLLERIYGAQAYLQHMQKKIGHSSDILEQSLRGPVEY